MRWYEFAEAEAANGAEHDRVVAAIPFPSFNASDPIFELLLERALTVTWTKPATRGRKSTWVEKRNPGSDKADPEK